MTSFTAIPFADITNFLSSIHHPPSNNQLSDYSTAWYLLKSGEINSMPPAIADWFIAWNLSNEKVSFDTYKTSEILLSTDLSELSHQLTLTHPDKERIIRILGYLGRLDNDINVFDQLPQEILTNIASNLDCKTISLICRISSGFNAYCEKNLDSVLRENLKQTYKFNLDKHTRQQLLTLCKISSQRTFISCGYDLSLILTDSNKVYCCGSDQFKLTLINIPENVIQMSAGYFHSLILSSTKQVYSFGHNINGQLGLGNNTDTNVPTLIPKFDNIVQVVGGDTSSMILTNDGKVYSFGYNPDGQLGLGNYDHTNIPRLISNLMNIIQISIKSSHALFLSDNNQVYSCGSNDHGQLGLGLKDKNNKLLPTLIQGLSNIYQISTGGSYSLALTNDGNVYVFGDNTDGQLGLNDNVDVGIPTLLKDFNNIIQISTGFDYSLILKNTGQVYAFGNNYSGQFGLGDNNNRKVPTLIQELPNVIYISCGFDHTLVLKDDGYIYAFGSNSSGQLGLELENNRSINVPILVPDFNIHQ